MAKLFGIDIAALLQKELAPGLLKGQLIYPVSQNSARDPLDPTNGIGHGTVNTAAFRGIANTYTDKEIDGELVLKEDRKFLIIANSIQGGVVPETGMKIELSGTPGTWFIVRVSRDPASATYTCQGRI